MLFNKTHLAIDIGSSSIKLLEMSAGGHKKLQRLGIELLPRGAIESGTIRDADKVLEVLRKLLRRVGIKPQNQPVSISVSGVSTLIKRVMVSLDEDSILDDLLYEEAKQQFHTNLDDMYFRYQEIPSQFNDQDKKSYLLVAARIETVEQYLDLLHKLKLKVGITDCDVFCLANMFDFNYPIADALTMAINVGASTTQVIFLYNGEFLYSREIYMGGNDVTNRIAEQLQLDLDAAEALKISISMGEQGILDRIRPAIAEINDQICFEINNTYNYFLNDEMSGKFQKVDHVFLSGGAAGTLDLASSISNAIKAPVQLINPFQRIDTKPSKVEMDFIMTQGALFGISVGLSLRDYSRAG